jgi:hypothetical protein
MICRFLRIDIQAPPLVPISLILNTDETITLLVRICTAHGAHNDRMRRGGETATPFLCHRVRDRLSRSAGEIIGFASAW